MATTPSALSAVIAASIISFVIGYWTGVGKSLFSYSKKVRCNIGRDNQQDFSDEDDSDIDLTDKDVNSDLGLFEECKLVLVVRVDLGMGKGKVAAQCSHATLACYKAALKAAPNIVSRWEKSGQPKITLKCDSEEEMLTLQAIAQSLGIVAKSIQDAGRTQIAPGSRTVLGIGPASKSLIDQVTGNLKLY